MPENMQTSRKSLLHGPVKESRSIEKVDNHLSVNENIVFPNEHHAQHLKYVQNFEVAHDTVSIFRN